MAVIHRAPRHEVIEGTGMRAMIAHGSAEARAWDGADPIRIIDASAAA
ncbi:glyoxalase [Burkholderia ambifaria]|uniref:Glyoxalase n=1 Tax=Burkholderia ambifaria TaxID=152480 RepID=A0AA41EC92_9BURK|nr:glyoxalase [Burkholderia ambifaria]MBR8132436.1 glyoxalase [Burkholderia ambifaria]PRD98644.1 glyoxalase [Burkholderia ambifaria]